MLTTQQQTIPTIGGSVKGLFTGSLNTASDLLSAGRRTASSIDYSMAIVETQLQGMYIESRISTAKAYVQGVEELKSLNLSESDAQLWLSK